jgi:hypothetical protein
MYIRFPGYPLGLDVSLDVLSLVDEVIE